MYEKYLDYLDKSGGVTEEQFIEDWEPIGSKVLQDLHSKELIEFYLDRADSLIKIRRIK